LILIHCRELSNLGRVLADGAHGEDAADGYGSGGGGGSGGGIQIKVECLGEGGAWTVSARGGRGEGMQERQHWLGSIRTVEVGGMD
jgi:hypothetical protein